MFSISTAAHPQLRWTCRRSPDSSSRRSPHVLSGAGRPQRDSASDSGARPGRNSALHTGAGTKSRRRAQAVQQGTVEAPLPPLEDAELKAGIANFYDESSALWEDMWGEHMHHGYYTQEKEGDRGKAGAEGRAEPMSRHQTAQVEMIEKSLEFAGVAASGSPQPRTILDAGCGIGGSARYLAGKYPGATVKAITLSPRQAQRGNQICASQGLQDRVELMVADAMSPPFPDSSFDLLWSMESGEHMPDKRKFVGELTRLASPGGKIIIVTWCHRNLDKAGGETELRDWEKGLLDQICDAYYLPAWCSADDYEQIASDLGLKSVKSGDWTEYVTPFWPAVIASALTVKGFLGLLKAGWTTMRGAIAMLLMVRGYSQGLIKFVIISAEK